MNNGFSVNFYKQFIINFLKDWVPEYVRNQIYNKLGKKIDSYGNIIEPEKNEEEENNNVDNSNKKQVTFKSINDVSELTNKIYNTSYEKLDKINK